LDLLRPGLTRKNDGVRGFYEKLGFRFHTSIPCWIDLEELLGPA